MIDTVIIQRCGCGEDDCVEILGLEESIYACFTCGYAGITPSGADNLEDEIHIGNLDAEVKRLREQFRLAYDWVDYQLPDGGMRDFAKYIGDEEE